MLQDFLVTPQRARTPVKALSGGERARLVIAKRFMEPGNLLVLDEPTNDLDIETLCVQVPVKSPDLVDIADFVFQ